MEERIRELTRRLSSREEAPASTEWESRKLRQRNEQAAKLSAQLQVPKEEEFHRFAGCGWPERRAEK